MMRRIIHATILGLILLRATRGTAEELTRVINANGTITVTIGADPTLTAPVLATDGVQYVQSTTYSSAQTALTATASADTTTAVCSGQLFATPNYTVQRMFLPFDLSTIPIGSTINSVTLSLTPSNFYPSIVVPPATNWNVIVRPYNAPLPLGSNLNDYGNCMTASPSNDSLWANTSTLAINVTSTNALATGGLTLGGVSTFCVFSSRDQAQTAPTGEERVCFWANENGSQAAVLTVNYGAVNTATPVPATNTPAVTPTRVPTNTPVPGGVPTNTPVPNCGQPSQ